MKQLNLNTIVRVKLTDYGKDIFYHRYDKLNEHIISGGGKGITPRYPDVDEKGFSKFQLWDFMSLYGDYFLLGSNNMVIQPLNFYIEEDDLEEVKDGTIEQ